VNVPKFSPSEFHNIIYAKFFCFSTEIKKWTTVIYIDNDVIIRENIDALSNLNFFHAAKDFDALLFHQLRRPFTYIQTFLHLSILKIFDPFDNAFNSGVMVFKTNIVKNWTSKLLFFMAKILSPISEYPDQLVLNLMYHKRWCVLDEKFNYFTILDKDNESAFALSYKRKVKKPKVLHFPGDDKPWSRSSPYYAEWKRNLNRANSIIFSRLI
jgi:lipopolysaccharide biosynthesis glycosyltransferase